MSDLQDGLAADSSATDQPAAGQNQHRSAREAIADLRLQRIEKLQSESLEKPDALTANLGAASGALLRIAVLLEDTIEDALTNTNPPERLARLITTIETYLKVMRQVDRFAQLDQRHDSGRQDGGPGKPR